MEVIKTILLEFELGLRLRIPGYTQRCNMALSSTTETGICSKSARTICWLPLWFYLQR